MAFHIKYSVNYNILSSKCIANLALVLKYADNNDGQKLCFKFHEMSNDYEDI